MTTVRPKVVLERAPFASRWLLAQVYIGLVFALMAMLGVFVVSPASDMTQLISTPPERLPEAGILLALSLIVLS